MANELERNSLDSAKYLYLRELSEPRDNSLRLVVQEAVVNPAGIGRSSYPVLPESKEIMTCCSPIESTDSCRTFELTWKQYVAYFFGALRKLPAYACQDLPRRAKLRGLN
jgi:hypothetical protein